MKEPKRIPLTDNPRNKEPQKIPLTKIYPESMIDDLYDIHEAGCGVVYTKKNENNQQDDKKSISELESDQIN
jgi:hypothetical protein